MFFWLGPGTSNLPGFADFDLLLREGFAAILDLLKKKVKNTLRTDHNKITIPFNHIPFIGAFLPDS